MFRSSFLLRSVALAFVVLCLCVSFACAQDPQPSAEAYSSSRQTSVTSLPNAPSASIAAKPVSKKSPYAGGGFAGSVRAHAVCGGGLDFQQGNSQGALAMCGLGFTFIPYTATEIGGMRLQDGSVHFYVSEDFIAPITPIIKRLRGEPYGIVGYTKVRSNSNRFDYGLGWEHHLGPSASLALEARDYLQFTDPVQHAVVFRLTIVGGGDWAD